MKLSDILEFCSMPLCGNQAAGEVRPAHLVLTLVDRHMSVTFYKISRLADSFLFPRCKVSGLVIAAHSYDFVSLHFNLSQQT